MTQTNQNKGKMGVIVIVLALIGALWAIDTTQNSILTGYQIADEAIDYTIPGFVLEKGWNLIGIATDMTGRTITDIQGNCNIKYAFAYDDAANLHLMATPTKAAPISINIEGNAMWLYAQNKCRYNPTTAAPERVINTRTQDLLTSWQIATTIITREMRNKKLQDIKIRGCDIEKAWVYQPSGVSEKQEEEESYVGWTRLLPNDQIADAYLGKGMVIKTGGNCISETLAGTGQDCASEIQAGRDGAERESLLKSNFFKTDKTADSIARGCSFELQMSRMFTSTKNTKINALSFEYKVGMALKQLGYPPFRYIGSHMLGYDSIIDNYDFFGLHLFQRRHGFAEADVITKEIMIMLDTELSEREKKDIELAKKYPPSDLFLEAPANAPPKEHLAALFVSFLSAMPDHLSEKPWTVEKFPFSGFTGGNFGLFVDSKNMRVVSTSNTEAASIAARIGDFRYCEPTYYPQFDDCLNQKSIVSTTWAMGRDRGYMNTMIHEYGHHIAKLKVADKDGTTADADVQFSKISFKLENGAPLSMLRPDAGHEEFISGYAKYNGYEDFADSFSAYIIGGKIFRERAKGTIYLKQKYDFLRDNVFAGYEYDTGDLEEFEKQITETPVLIRSHPLAFRQVDYVWDYTYIK